MLVFPDDPGTGFPLTYDRVVPGCLALLQSWATGADRSTRAAASLAGFLATLGPDALGTLLDGAKPVSPTPESKRGAFFKQAAPPPGLAVPGGRLLSGQLTALAQCCRDQDWHEIRLAHGHLLVVGVSGEIVEVTPAQAEAWSA